MKLSLAFECKMDVRSRENDPMEFSAKSL